MLDTRRAERQRGSEITSETPFRHLRQSWRNVYEVLCGAVTNAGQPGLNGCRVGESILVDSDVPKSFRR